MVLFRFGVPHIVLGLYLSTLSCEGARRDLEIDPQKPELRRQKASEVLDEIEKGKSLLTTLKEKLKPKWWDKIMICGWKDDSTRRQLENTMDKARNHINSIDKGESEGQAKAAMIKNVRSLIKTLNEESKKDAAHSKEDKKLSKEDLEKDARKGAEKAKWECPEYWRLMYGGCDDFASSFTELVSNESVADSSPPGEDAAGGRGPSRSSSGSRSGRGGSSTPKSEEAASGKRSRSSSSNRSSRSSRSNRSSRGGSSPSGRKEAGSRSPKVRRSISEASTTASLSPPSQVVGSIGAIPKMMQELPDPAAEEFEKSAEILIHDDEIQKVSTDLAHALINIYGKTKHFLERSQPMTGQVKAQMEKWFPGRDKLNYLVAILVGSLIMECSFWFVGITVHLVLAFVFQFHFVYALVACIQHAFLGTWTGWIASHLFAAFTWLWDKIFPTLPHFGDWIEAYFESVPFVAGTELMDSYKGYFNSYYADVKESKKASRKPHGGTKKEGMFHGFLSRLDSANTSFKAAKKTARQIRKDAKRYFYTRMSIPVQFKEDELADAMQMAHGSEGVTIPMLVDEHGILRSAAWLGGE
eukprot:TRINITY_DN3644_c0_g4_i1.p1 TRINITY_DN3644_c0_g4~~TRINITY_DN3644_c0_g4_i1.p1  ORF type:complete len:583 (-),score=99.96 TRINITY_DN3644_c0_g4_i1:137-1885(-)